MALGPLRWTEDDLRRIAREEIDGADQRRIESIGLPITLRAGSLASIRFDSDPDPTPPGWSSWAVYARWRIDGLLVAVNRWRDKAEHRRLDELVQLSIIESLETDVLLLQQKLHAATSGAIFGERVGSIEHVGAKRVYREIPGPNLINGILDMIAGGRLKASDLPDDWEWLKRKVGPELVDAALAVAWSRTSGYD